MHRSLCKQLLASVVAILSQLTALWTFGQAYKAAERWQFRTTVESLEPRFGPALWLHLLGTSLLIVAGGVIILDGSALGARRKENRLRRDRRCLGDVERLS